MSGENDARQCYFCREDTEVALDDHHVVPKRLVGNDDDADQDITERTEVLCSNCHRKLHTVIDPLMEYLSDRYRQNMDEAEIDTEFVTGAEL